MKIRERRALAPLLATLLLLVGLVAVVDGMQNIASASGPTTFTNPASLAPLRVAGVDVLGPYDTYPSTIAVSV